MATTKYKSQFQKPTSITQSAALFTRDMLKFSEPTANVYESIHIIGKRSKQINVKVKEELTDRLSEFVAAIDNLEEVHENREQIEISKFYEKLPKPTMLATEEFLEGKVYYRRADMVEGTTTPKLEEKL